MRTLTDRLAPQQAYALAPGEYLLFAGHPGLLLIAGQGPDPKARAYTWYFRHRDSDGRIARLKLGRWPAISFADACSARERIDRERRRGVNHLADQRKTKVAIKAAAEAERLTAYTMRTLVADHLAAIARTRKKKGVYDTTLVMKPLAECDEPVVEWTRSKAGVLLHTIADRAPSMARCLRAEMTIATESAITRGLVPESYPNPWSALKHDPSLRAKTKAGRGTRFLNDAELATFLAWLPTSAMSPAVRDALHLTLLTGARSGEVIAMKQADVDLAAGTWTISANKTDTPRTVRLSRQALAIVQRRATKAYLFPSPKGKHIAQRALVWSVVNHDRDRKSVVKHRRKSGLASWSAHDLRRSARTALSRLGCPTEIAEAAIGHTKAGIVAVYDLHGYEAEVGTWLQTWADHLDALSSPNVVPLRKQA